MRKTSHLILLVILALSTLSACSAVRYRCSMMPTADKKLQYGQVHLAMTNFTYEKPGVEPLPATIDQQAKALYPAIFNDDCAGLPVKVDIKRSSSGSPNFIEGLTFALSFCTLELIPMPLPRTDTFTVKATVMDSTGQNLYEKDGSFKIKACIWGSIWPWGVLPVPGSSDLPRDTYAGTDFPDAASTTAARAKINQHAAACVAAIVAQSLKDADQSKLEAAYMERRSRIQDMSIDGQPCQGFLTMTPNGAPQPGSTFSLLVYKGKASRGVKPLDEVVVARYDESCGWQPLTGYLRHAHTLTSARALMTNGIPTRVVIRNPEAPAVQDFIATPDLKAADCAENLRWSNAMLLDAKNRSMDALLRDEGREGLLVMATRIEKSILDLSEQAERSKDHAQSMVEKGEGDPAAERELAVLCRQRIEILKPILAVIKMGANAQPQK